MKKMEKVIRSGFLTSWNWSTENATIKENSCIENGVIEKATYVKVLCTYSAFTIYRMVVSIVLYICASL